VNSTQGGTDRCGTARPLGRVLSSSEETPRPQGRGCGIGVEGWEALCRGRDAQCNRTRRRSRGSRRESSRSRSRHEHRMGSRSARGPEAKRGAEQILRYAASEGFAPSASSSSRGDRCEVIDAGRTVGVTALSRRGTSSDRDPDLELAPAMNLRPTRRPLKSTTRPAHGLPNRRGRSRRRSCHQACQQSHRNAARQWRRAREGPRVRAILVNRSVRRHSCATTRRGGASASSSRSGAQPMLVLADATSAAPSEASFAGEFCRGSKCKRNTPHLRAGRGLDAFKTESSRVFRARQGRRPARSRRRGRPDRQRESSSTR